MSFEKAERRVPMWIGYARVSTEEQSLDLQLDALKRAGCRRIVTSLTDAIDTTTPAGRFFFHIMASLAQRERELPAERTRAGLAAARRRGRVGGRKRRVTPGKVESAREILTDRMPPRDVAQSLGVSVPTLDRWVPAAR
jgi:DNA invertase Pin-like site-specific DNA recombinase